MPAKLFAKASMAAKEVGKKKGAKGGKGDDEAHGILEGISSLHSWIKTQTMIRPTKLGKKKDDMSFDDDDDEDVVISLCSKDPQACKGVVRFDYTNGEFVPVKLTEWMIDHLEIESTVLHKESEEAKIQMQREGANKLGDDDDEDDDGEDEDDTEKKGKKKGKKLEESKRRDSNASDKSEDGDQKLTNQFSFVERATQTMNNALKSSDMQTEPPPRANFCETVNQWVIYDSYVAYETAKELAEERELKKEQKEVKNVRRRLLESPRENSNDEVNKKMLRAAKILERMVNQNTYDEIAQDFRFYEDASDEFREVEGTLLPLWKFGFEKAKKLEITALCWNPAYNDLFAAGFGSYNFYEQSDPGVVCVFSLKNPSYPEYLCHAPCGVMCLDIHPEHPHMLVVGLYDGNIAVYNLQKNTGQPSYQSDARNGKHKDIVWQVKWAADNLDGYLNFYSVSGDGRVSNWTIVKTALWVNDTLLINFCKTLQNLGEESVSELLMDSGRAISFKPDDDSTFLVGTDEGMVYLCTTQYSSRYLNTYHAHNTPVYNIQWNTFIPNIFITCASEWIIKIWDKDCNKPLFMFDLNSQVGDVAWAPYSSTVFAAVTIDGKVHIYDLYINKYNPVCVQAVVPKKKARLNHIAFNQTHPIIIVGDSRGTVQCLKLSPNLRRQSKEVKTALLNKDLKKAGEMEIKKLDQLLGQVREPDNDSDLEIETQ